MSPRYVKISWGKKKLAYRTKSFWLGTSDMKPRGKAHDPETLNNIRVNMKLEMSFSFKKENSF